MTSVQQSRVAASTQQARTAPQRPQAKNQAVAAALKARPGLIKRMAQALGLSTPERPQPKVSRDRFHTQGTYDHVARSNLTTLAKGTIMAQAKPTDPDLLHFLNNAAQA